MNAINEMNMNNFLSLAQNKLYYKNGIRPLVGDSIIFPNKLTNNKI